MRVLVEEGLLNENPSPIINLDLFVEEDEEQSDLSTGLIVASQVLSTGCHQRAQKGVGKGRPLSDVF